MASKLVQSLGAAVAAQVPEHPERARALLRTAYRLVGFQMRHLPPKTVPGARCYMQGATAVPWSAPWTSPARRLV